MVILLKKRWNAYQNSGNSRCGEAPIAMAMTKSDYRGNGELPMTKAKRAFAR